MRRDGVDIDGRSRGCISFISERYGPVFILLRERWEVPDGACASAIGFQSTHVALTTDFPLQCAWLSNTLLVRRPNSDGWRS